MTSSLQTAPRMLLLAAGLAMAAAASGQAQTIGEPLPGRKAVAAQPAPFKPERRARPCPEYGPGFVRLEGSSACVRVGGSVRVEYGKSSRSGYGSGADAGVHAEARTETSFGSVRAVASGRVRRDTGLDSGPFR